MRPGLGAVTTLAVCALVCRAAADTCTEVTRCVTPWTTPTLLASPWPRLVADGAGQVYFANASKVALTSSSGASMIVAGTVLVPCAGRDDVVGFDIVARDVVWATRSAICSAPADGVTHTTNVLVRDAALTAFAADAAWIAYAVRLADGSSEVRARPMRSSRSLVVASTAATVRHVALAGSAVYWVDGLAVRASPLAFAATLADGPIVTAGPTMNIGVASSDVVSLRIGPLGAFVTTPRGLEHITLGTSRPVVTTPVDDFALDGSNAYWTSERRGLVARTSLFTGTTTVLAAHVRPGGVAVDGQSAFFADQSQGVTTIVQITPK